jgi:hypothetical protein
MQCADSWGVFGGRIDNQITLSNEFKFDPTEMENAVTPHRDVDGVFIDGSYRSRLCLVTEMTSEAILASEEEKNELPEELRPTIHKPMRQHRSSDGL